MCLLRTSLLRSGESKPNMVKWPSAIKLPTAGNSWPPLWPLFLPTISFSQLSLARFNFNWLQFNLTYFIIINFSFTFCQWNTLFNSVCRTWMTVKDNRLSKLDTSKAGNKMQFDFQLWVFTWTKVFCKLKIMITCSLENKSVQLCFHWYCFYQSGNYFID